MTDYNPKILEVNSLIDAEKEINKIGSDPGSYKIMAPKMITRVVKFENVVLQDAIIIKQDMLSIGGEVAVPRNTFELHDKKGDILIIGTVKQLNDLVVKLSRHYPRLKKISEELLKIVKEIK